MCFYLKKKPLHYYSAGLSRASLAISWVSRSGQHDLWGRNSGRSFWKNQPSTCSRRLRKLCHVTKTDGASNKPLVQLQRTQRRVKLKPMSRYVSRRKKRPSDCRDRSREAGGNTRPPCMKPRFEVANHFDGRNKTCEKVLG